MAKEKTTAKDKAAVAKKPKKRSIFSRIGRFFKDLKSEFSKVVWPSRKQVVNNTFVVIVFCGICAVVLSGIDFLLGSLVRLIAGV